MSNPIQACKAYQQKSHFDEQNGFILKLMGLCTRELEKVGLLDRAKILQNEVLLSDSFSNALAIMSKHLDIE